MLTFLGRLTAEKLSALGLRPWLCPWTCWGKPPDP